MSVCVNVCVYVCSAWLLSHLARIFVENGVGEYINKNPLKPGQIKKESAYGLVACVIFAVGSLASRELFSFVWPESILDLFVQVLCFAAFYETYSYFVHRLLHLKFLIKYHGVHHSSVRVTPWSAYSVHPIEATFIGFSAPIFMLLFDLSLGVALALHVMGMMFTILLHSNFRYGGKSSLALYVFDYPAMHAQHHLDGNVNFGFVNRFWDVVLKTRSIERC